MKPHRPYELQEYDPVWKETFSNIAETVRPILGDNLITVEHVGSTSIEGMVAKPQIDVLAIVKNLDLVEGCYEAFQNAGFVPRGREYVGVGDEYVTKDAPDGKRITGIHIFEEGHPEIIALRNFRDYLKSHKEDRELYIATKRDLYAKHHDNYHGYDSGKSEVIHEINNRVKVWSETLH